MKRNEILTVAQFYKRGVEYNRFNTCQAWVSEVIFCSAIGCTIQLIKSYDTIVAVVDHDNKWVYELDKWSRTTSKQVSQICNRFFSDYTRELLKLDYSERCKL